MYAFHNYKPYTLNSPLYLGVPAIAVGLSAISLLAFCFLLTQKICTPIPFPVSCTQIPKRSQRMPLQSLTRSARNKRFHEIKKGREKSRPHNFIKLTADSQLSVFNFQFSTQIRVSLLNSFHLLSSIFAPMT